MKIRTISVLGVMALCLSLAAGTASASGPAATLSADGGLTGALHISDAPAGLYTVFELTETGYVLVGAGAVGGSGSSDASIVLIPTANPSFQVRLRASGGMVVMAVVIDDDHLWWWD